MKWYSKLLELREHLGIKQGDFAVILNTSQKELSALERGKKTFLPNWYLSYLIENKYDLNSLYDERLKLSKLDVPDDEERMFNVLRKMDRSTLVKYLFDSTDIMKAFFLEADLSGKESSLFEKVSKLEAVTSALLLHLGKAENSKSLKGKDANKKDP